MQRLNHILRSILRIATLTSLTSFDEYIFETIDVLTYFGIENFAYKSHAFFSRSPSALGHNSRVQFVL
ncbi:hypothetical protein VUR80DRAFT_8207 [Thermomyces stellatus]